MATATLYCTEARKWNWQFSWWESFNDGWGSTTNMGRIGYIPEYTDGTSTAGVCMLSFDALPANAVITAATLKLKNARYSGGSATHTVKLRISSTYQAYSTSEPSGYQSVSLPFTTTLTERTIDITAQMQSYATAGSACYLYVYESYPSPPDYNNDFIQGDESSTPHISITYTVPTTDSNITIGTASGNKKCVLYIGGGGVAKKVTDIYIGTASGNKRITSS